MDRVYLWSREYDTLSGYRWGKMTIVNRLCLETISAGMWISGLDESEYDPRERSDHDIWWALRASADCAPTIDEMILRF